MLQNLPVLVGGGIFHSRSLFPERAITDPRTVTDYELEYFPEDGGVSILNGREYPIRAGAVLFAVPGDVRRSRLHFKALFLHFRFHDRELHRRLAGCSGVFTPPTESPLPRQLQAVCDLAYERGAELRVAAALLGCMEELLRCRGEMPHGQQEPLVARTQAYIDHHFAQPLTLETLAAASHLSPVYFHKCYTAAAGETPHATLLRRRVDAARLLLRTTELPLAQVAQNCGFSTQAYFSSCFKQQVGKTPGEYRRTVRYPERGVRTVGKP